MAPLEAEYGVSCTQAIKVENWGEAVSQRKSGQKARLPLLKTIVHTFPRFFENLYIHIYMYVYYICIYVCIYIIHTQTYSSIMSKPRNLNWYNNVNYTTGLRCDE